MKRYYYDCPLESAYMAKHFEMKIYMGDLVADNIWEWKDCADSASLEDDIIPKRFNIHPDSLPLLEPQVGDLIESSALPTTMQYFRIDIVCDEYVGLERIIERNGKVFFSPKCEE